MVGMVGCHKGGALVKLLHRCVCLLACLLACIVKSSQVQVIYGLPKRYTVGIFFPRFGQGKGEGKGKVVCEHLLLPACPFFVPSFLDLCTVLFLVLVGSSPRWDGICSLRAFWLTSSGSVISEGS